MSYVSTANNPEVGLEQYSQAINSQGGFAGTYVGRDIDGVTSLRQEFTQGQYDELRPEGALPRTHSDILVQCDLAYSTIGPVRHVIDLMGDFSSMGIRLSHPNKSTEKIYRNWFTRVDGPNRSERLASNLVKYGTAIIRRDTTPYNRKTRKSLNRSKADVKPIKELNIKSGHIPSSYTFLNPCMIDAINGSSAIFTKEEFVYGIKIPFRIKHMVRSPSSPLEKRFVAQLPKDIAEAIKKDDFDFFPLDNDNLIVRHYKRDDWQVWSKPIIYSILRDIKLLEKLKLADFSVLDSAMDLIRIFKLGSLDHKLLPDAGAFERLQEALLAQNPGGIRTLLWGPDIELIESKTNAFEILGEEKYKPALNHIYDGLGIPPTLTGIAGTSGGTTNNLVSLRILIKRLEYVRRELVEFWTDEIEMVRRAIGARFPAEIEFDISNFGDEESEKRLYIELADRNIISHEYVQHKFGACPNVEKNRINREHVERQDKKMVPKAGPWYDPEWDNKVLRTLIEKGWVSPSEVGINVEVNKEMMKSEQSAPITKDEPLSKPGGRPSGTPDKEQRKKRPFKPVTKAVDIWAAEAQSQITKIVNPAILNSFNKKNMRSLTADQSEEAEQLKFTCLCNLPPHSILSENLIITSVYTNSYSSVLYNQYKSAVNSVEGPIGRSLTLDEKRAVQREIYIELTSE